MRIDIITLFPAMFSGPFDESIIRRARAAGVVDIQLVDLRRYAEDRRGTVDDAPFGGGAGMVLKPEPIYAAIEDLRTPQAHIVYLTPQGAPFVQATARRLAGLPHLIVLCGHYEGVDERIRQTLVDEEISLGDFVLSNGSLAAAVVVDAIVRLLPGALGSDQSALSDSFGPENLLEHPHYTRPAEFRGLCVPEVLRSGDHARIAAWRQEQARLRTAARRPDLIAQE